MEYSRSIGIEISVLSNVIKRQGPDRTIRDITNGLTLTSIQCWVMGHIRANRGEDIFQRDIEIKFNIRRSTASGILRLMEKKGLIKRESVDYDARLKKLVLTPVAIKMSEKVEQEVAMMEERLRQGLTLEEQKAFFAILDKIKKNID